MEIHVRIDGGLLGQVAGRLLHGGDLADLREILLSRGWVSAHEGHRIRAVINRGRSDSTEGCREQQENISYMHRVAVSKEVEGDNYDGLTIK